MKTSELTGTFLDFWVARAEGVEAKDMLFPLSSNGVRVCAIIPRYEVGPATVYCPSKDWAQGGVLIDKYNLGLERGLAHWTASTWTKKGRIEGSAGMPLEAICRAVVRSKFGDDVEDI